MSALRILVIDDSLTVRKLVEIALRGTPHAVDYAATGAAGIASALATPPDLVLCDFVLPDLRGSEVCRTIAASPAGSRITLVVMSGKQDQIRNQFADVAIFDWLAKPFSAELVAALVDRVARRRPASFASTRETAIAMASSFRASLYEVLCDRLARIPAWSNELGAETPATFFARKLFTEPVLAELFEALLPIYQRTRPRMPDRNLLAEGSLAGLRPARLLALAVGAGGTSEIVLQSERGTTVFFVTAGRLYTNASGPNPAHTTSGLASVLAGRDGRFTWRRLELLPPAVCGDPVPLAQLQLECLRLQDDLAGPADTEVVLRAPGFSKRIGELQLATDEQQVLALVDDASTLAEVATRAGLTAAFAGTLVARFLELGVLRTRSDERGLGPDRDRQLVVVVEPDEPGFRAGLARHLATHRPTAGVLAVDGATDADGILRRDPAVVIVNATLFGPLALDLARRVATRGDHGRPRTIAVLESPGALEHDLRQAGCDAVLVKPVHVLDLDWILVAAGRRAALPPAKEA